MMSPRFLTVIVLVYTVVWVVLLPTRLAESPDVTFSSDARHYNAAAVHLTQEGFYSVDGATPFVEREPGYSVFLALLYLLFGVENRLTIFLAQALLFLVSVLAFAGEFRRIAPPIVASLSILLLLTLPSAFHVIFSVYREGFALSLALLSTTTLLLLQRAPSLHHAILAGLLLGALALTYLPFLFYPLAVVGFLWLCRFRMIHLIPLVVVPAILLSAWGMRNASDGRGFRLTDGFRTSIMWYARAEQAVRVRGRDPLRCLYAEYVSRDWSGLPSACSTTALFHARWPRGEPLGTEHEIARESQRVILEHIPGYLWFSLFEILELHLPFVDGWGFWYNVLTAVGQVLIYVGCLLALPHILRREYGFLLLLLTYSTVVFSLTDATPRYLMPTIFCYAVYAALGYTRLLRHLRA